MNINIKMKTIFLRFFSEGRTSYAQATKIDPKLHLTPNRETSLLHSYYSKINTNFDGFDLIWFVVKNEFIVTFNFNQFIYKNYFIDTIKSKLQGNSNEYFVLIKIKHDIDLYKMAGKQFVLTYQANKDISEDLGFLYDILVSKLNVLLEQYSLISENILWVQCIFKTFDKKILNDLKFFFGASSST